MDRGAAGAGDRCRTSPHREPGAGRPGGARSMIAGFFSTPVHAAIGVIFALLIFASVIAAILRRTAPGEAAPELSRRVMSWWAMILIFTVAILTNRVVSTVFLAFVSFLAL